MTAASIRLLALTVACAMRAALADAQRQLSRNDRCANAAEIAAWPFRDMSDSLPGGGRGDDTAARPDSGTIKITCDDPSMVPTQGEADGAWYAIRSAPAGAPLVAEVKGMNGEVHADILYSKSDHWGEGEGECPPMFHCVEDMGVEDVSGTGDPYPEVAYRWIAEEGATYYIRVHAADADSLRAGYAFYVDVSEDGSIASVA